jgi:hypothetical protein
MRTFVPEGLSESRSPVRSAGNEAKRDVRPARDDRNIRFLVSHTARRLSASIDRPVPPSSRRRFVMARPSLWARRSSKSEDGILTTADRPGRIAL